MCAELKTLDPAIAKHADYRVEHEAASERKLKMKRYSTIVPGRDCIRSPCGEGNCGKTEGGNHGIVADDWLYVVSDGRVALSLRVSSGVYPSSVPKSPGLLTEPSGVVLHVHTAFPTERESLRNGDKGESCGYVEGGRCFADDGQYLTARELFTDLSGAASFEQSEGFWAGLEVAWQQLAAPAYKERVDKQFQRCNHCDGVGTVAADTNAKR